MRSGVTLAIDTAPLNSDPYWPADYDGCLVSEAIIRTLVSPWSPPDGSSVGEGAAIEIERQGSGDRWRVHLDTSLSWSDGEPLSVVHVIQSVMRIMDRQHSMLFRLLRIGDGGELPIQIVDESRVDFWFARPLSFAPALFALPQLAPRHLAGNHVGAPVLGDYELASESADEIVLTYHKHMREPAAVHRPERLTFKVFSRLESAIAGFSRGDVDISPITSFGPSEIEAFSNHKNHVARDILIFGALDFGVKATLKPELRHTLGMALDRGRITQSCPDLVRPFLGQTDPWYGEPSTAPGAPRTEPSGVLVDQVRAALGKEIEIPYADFNPNREIVTETCRQLAEVFGITATGRPLSYLQYVKAVISRRFALLYTLTVAEFPHPASLLMPWRSDNPNAQRLKFSDAILDDAIDRASESFDDEQHDLWRSADHRWLDLMPRIPLVQVRAHCVHSTRVSDVRLSASGLVDYRRLTLA
jgi:ABC-type transport system substrate-binding protein